MMKSKLSWIPFIPLALAGCFFKLAQVLFPSGAILGLSALKLEYCYLGAVFLIFVFTFVFCMIDKQIAKYYLPRLNPPAGIFGLLLALVLAADGANSLFNIFSSGSVDVLKTIGAILALLSAVVFVVFGMNQLFNVRESKKFSLLNVFPALFCAVRMILSFVGFTTISIREADVASLICYILCTLFFYHYAVGLSLIKTKNTVKFCLIFGLPAVAALIPYGVYHLAFRFDTEVVTNNLMPLEMLLMGLYILSFLIELSINVLKDESIIIVKDEEIAVNAAEEKVEGFIASATNEDENDKKDDTSYLESRDTEGFLYQEVAGQTNEPEENEAMAKEADSYLTKVTEDYNDSEENRAQDYDKRLDEIDKLIIEINNQSD